MADDEGLCAGGVELHGRVLVHHERAVTAVGEDHFRFEVGARVDDHPTAGADHLRSREVQLLAAGQLDAAMPDLRRAVDLNPRAYDALFNLGMALWELGRREEATPVLERFVREAPPSYAQDVARVRMMLTK